MVTRSRRSGSRRRMVRHVSLWVAIGCLPILCGQACPQFAPPVIEPVAPNLDITGAGTPTEGNVAPTFSFLAPLVDVAAEVGDTVTIRWIDEDPDNNASIMLLVDPDGTYGNGNEIVLVPLIPEDPDTTPGTDETSPGTDRYELDTTTLVPGTYRIVARVTDGVNPQQLITAPGRLLLYGAGLLPGNLSPSILVTEPALSLGVTQGDTVNITFCGRDPDDDGGTPATTPDVILLVDVDDDPTNDLDLTAPDAEETLTTLCQAGSFPAAVTDENGRPVAYVLSCLKDNDCTDLTTDALSSTWLVDVGKIPPSDTGQPYRIRATMWDHVNLPVHSYAPGSIYITTLGSGIIDLGEVGRTISGTKFYGFNSGDRAGSTGSDLGDIDGDGVDGIGTFYRGSLIDMKVRNQGAVGAILDVTVTDGITSVARLDDVTGDGLPDILFGMPYVEAFFDDTDDDPCDSVDSCGCYPDIWPNPLSTDSGEDDITGYDYREGTYTVNDLTFLCTNDGDISSETPINGGYAIVVGSDNDMNASVHRFGQFGQEGTSVASDSEIKVGARFRGAWYPPGIYDETQTQNPFPLFPDNRFGQTVASMPDMLDTSPTTSPRYGSTLIVSAPGALEARGLVLLIPSPFGLDSYPFYTASCEPTCSPRAVHYPSSTGIAGESPGDQLGYAKPAGDFNLDGSRDVLMGAPGADRDGLRDNGIVYIFFGRPDLPVWDDYGGDWVLDLGKHNPARLEIHGTRNDDRFGEMQTIVGDVNQDGLPDIGFASAYADGPGGVDSGFIGIVFGGRKLTGESFYTVDQVGTAQLPGVRIYGIQPGGHAGMVINNAGDFNGDGTDDLLIVAPDERRIVDGVNRRGVAYLIFGGTHMMGNRSFNLSQVGTDDLPGVVFVSPYAVGSADEAPIDWASAAGDVNSDGFDDILIGLSEADFVNPLEPSQRRNDAGEMYLIYGNNTGSNIVQP